MTFSKKPKLLILVSVLLIVIVAVVIILKFSGIIGKDDSQQSDQGGNKRDPRNSDIVATFTPDSKTAFQYNSPTITDNYIYVGTSTKIDPGGDPSSVIAALPENY